MLQIRIHVITTQEVEEKKKEPVRDWRLNLPEAIGASDALKIAYVLQYDDKGDAELFRVRKCVCNKAGQRSGRLDRFSLELEASRAMREEAVKELFKNYKPGTDLDELFVNQLENWLAAGYKVSEDFELPRFGLKAMNFDDAREAIANYYSVDETQIQIRIVG